MCFYHILRQIQESIQDKYGLETERLEKEYMQAELFEEREQLLVDEQNGIGATQAKNCNTVVTLGKGLVWFDEDEQSAPQNTEPATQLGKTRNNKTSVKEPAGEEKGKEEGLAEEIIEDDREGEKSQLNNGVGEQENRQAEDTRVEAVGGVADDKFFCEKHHDSASAARPPFTGVCDGSGSVVHDNWWPQESTGIPTTSFISALGDDAKASWIPCSATQNNAGPGDHSKPKHATGNNRTMGSTVGAVATGVVGGAVGLVTLPVTGAVGLVKGTAKFLYGSVAGNATGGGGYHGASQIETAFVSEIEEHPELHYGADGSDGCRDISAATNASDPACAAEAAATATTNHYNVMLAQQVGDLEDR